MQLATTGLWIANFLVSGSSQESVGHNVEKRLTYWAFFLSALRELLLGPICSSRSFVERLTGLRSTISGFRGGLAGTCLLIAPRSTMQDQDLAEVILMTADASADEKKFATLRFPVSGQTLKLDSILTENVQRIQTKQAEAKKIVCVPCRFVFLLSQL